MKKTLTRIALTALAAFLLLSCNRTGTEVVPFRHVFIMYAAAYSNLSASIAEDVKELCGGEIPYAGSGDVLLVYAHHTRNNANSTAPTNPVLFRVYRDLENNQHRDTLSVYPDTDVSSSPEVLHKVLSQVHETFPAESYGLLFSSHARGWLPVGYEEQGSYFFTPGKKRAQKVSEFEYPLTKWLGIEYGEGSGIDIRDFADAIPMKLDYIIFDACLMGCVEVAYEIREKCRYMAFSPTEILSNGFVYTTMASRLINVSKPQLQQVCQDYFDFYMAQRDYYQSATITLMDCSRMDALATVCAEITAAHYDELRAMDRNKVQAYFYNELHWFYDLRDMLERAGASADELSLLNAALDDCVIYAAATPRFFNLKLENVCGLSMYFPYPDREVLNTYYKTLAWNKATGLIR